MNTISVDVRTPQEYREGRIPGSENVPLQTIDKVTSMEENRDVPLFVYCDSGARSRQALSTIQQMGYTNVTWKSAVLAGGFIGLELAENLRKLGLDVTIVQRPRQL